MTDSYKEMLQRTATKLWEARTEYARVDEEHRLARARLEEASKRLRDYEGQLGQSVGENITTRAWLVRTGTAVIADYRNGTTYIKVLELEPQE